MTWFKLDDQFHSHPKVIVAGNAAVGLYCRLGTYCADKLTDGFVAKAIAHSMGTRSEINALTVCPIPDTRPLLVAVEGGYQMADYLQYNPTRQQVLTERRKAKDRMDKLRGRSPERTREQTPNEHPNSNGNSARSSPTPDPDPVPNEKTGTDDDSVDTPEGRSSSVEQIIATTAKAIALKDRDHPKPAFIAGIARNLRTERLDEINACVTAGLSTYDAAVRLDADPWFIAKALNGSHP